jgi:hypothetical protein
MSDNWLISQSIDLVRGSFSATAATRTCLIGESHAHTWQIAVSSDGEPANLSGFAATAYMVRADGVTIMVEGEITGSAVSFTLSEPAYAVLGRVRGIARIIRDTDAKVITLSEIRLEVIAGMTNTTLDSGTGPYWLDLIEQLLNTGDAKRALEVYAAMRIQSNDAPDLYGAVCEFYSNAVSGKVYGAEFSRYEVSPESTGIKTDENARPEFAVCAPGTNATAAIDPYAKLALFAPININYTIGEDLEPVITEIENVTAGFSLTNPNGLAGVMQMTAFVHVYGNEAVKGVKYSDTRIDENYLPLPESVRAIDDTVRPFVIHAKYIAGKDAAGRLTSASGLHPAAKLPGSKFNTLISHDSQIALWRQRGPHYCGSSLCDKNFLHLMLMLKYARLDSTEVMAGSLCGGQTSPALAETGVKRGLLHYDERYEKLFPIGSSISLGAHYSGSGSSSRGIIDNAIVTSIEKVYILDTEATPPKNIEYIAVNVDAPAPFTTVKDDFHYIRMEPWRSGATDNVRGNDGSPYDNHSEEEPFKLQGIECMTGVYETLADTVISHTYGQMSRVYLTRRAADITSDEVWDDMMGSTYRLKERIPIPDDDYMPIAEVGDSLEGLLVATKFIHEPLYGPDRGGPYKAEYKFRSQDETNGWRQWMTSTDNDRMSHFGPSGYKSDYGLPYVFAGTTPDEAYFYAGCRACGTGGNRGKYSG